MGADSKLRHFLGFAALALAAGAFAAETELAPVAVTAMKDPVSKSYRRMLAGMDLFEAKHALAPEASLRYRLLPRRRDTRMDAISLDVIGENVALPVRVARDGTFSLERDAKAREEEAAVMPNRRAGTMTWRAEIRSPGVPPGMRRLGDLRLECEVGMEADLVSVSGWLFSNPARRRMGYCSDDPVEYLFFAERPLFGVTLVSDGRRETLPAALLYAGSSRTPLSRADLARCDCEVLLDRTYYLPLGDKSWPDDTLVQFEYMDDLDDGTPRFVSAGSRKDEVRGAFGEAAAAIRFDSGYEAWVYRGGDTKPPAEPSELLVLFDPAGRVANSRLSATPCAACGAGSSCTDAPVPPSGRPPPPSPTRCR